MKSFLIIALIVFTGLLWACQNQTTIDPLASNKGFVEQEYDYTVTVNGAVQAKKGYKRATLTKAYFALRETSTLPDSLKRFRQVELFLYSDGGQYGVAQQPDGVSSVQLSVVDTLSSTQPLMPFTYRLSTQSYLATNKKPVALSLKSTVRVPRIEATGENAFEGSFTGQDSKNLSILYLGNDIYQINANGISGSKVHNVFYTGRIEKQANIK